MLLKLVKAPLVPVAFILTFVITLISPNEVFANQKTYSQSLCDLTLDFSAKPKTKQQTLKLNANVSMELTNAVAINDEFSARIATNVGCQKLMGASYTGSEIEWANFFDSANQGLIKGGYQAIEFTLVGSNDKVFSSALTKTFVAKEYNYTGAIGNNKQLIKNLALLDKGNNTLYTFSVSGNVMVESNISLEFERLLASIKKASVSK